MEEMIKALLIDLAAKYPLIAVVLFCLGGLVIVAQTYIALTPSKSDDAWYEKIKAVPYVGAVIKVFEYFAPFQRK